MRITKVTSMDGKRGGTYGGLSGLGYSHLFDNMLEGVCITDEFGYIDYINGAYASLFTLNRQHYVGERIYNVQHDDILLRAFREKSTVSGKLNFLDAKQVEVSASPIYYENQFKGVLAFYKSIEISNCDTIQRKVMQLPVNFQDSPETLDESFQNIKGKSDAIKSALRRAQKASKSMATILIGGESGTGKELIARAIHDNSKHAQGPFIAINCGAISANLIESELFGHEQGAFTGAIKKKIGKFEQAKDGTIFLDEIGDLPLEMQVKLLRVLQEREYMRIGGETVIKTNARIISATNKNLEAMVKDGTFREDLYYRLNVIPINLPSLKERREDITILIHHFVEKICEDFNREVVAIDDEAMQALKNYDWPGNIRELENMMERLIVLLEQDTITLEALPKNITELYEMNNLKYRKSQLINTKNDGGLAKLEEYEREIIKLAIDKFGSFNAAAKALGITHKTVAFKARKYNIVDY